MTSRLMALLQSFSRYFSQNVAGSSGISFREQMRWGARRWLPLLGWPGMLAIGLLIICPPFYFTTIRPIQDRLDVLQSKDAAAREQNLNTGKINYAGISPNEQLARFYDYFPSEKDSPRWLGKLVEVAGRNGLILNHGDYTVVRDSVGQLRRFKIALPVKGKYPQIRKFLASLTTEIPFMSLENVQFERKDILDSTLQVKIMLTLYLGQES